MKISLLVFAILFSVAVKAQQWCPMGAQWTYNYFKDQVGEGFSRCTYEKDTIVQSQSCKKLVCISVVSELILSHGFQFDTAYPNPIYTFARNDSVFFFQSGSFVCDYFFNSQKGDTLIIASADSYCFQNDTAKQAIDTTGIIEINNQALRYYTTSALSNSVYLTHDTIIERIGPISNYILFHFYCLTDGDGYSFRCYKDDSFSVYQPNQETACDYLLGISEIEPDVQVSVYPNPASTDFNLKLAQTPATETYFSVFDAAGRMVKRDYITSISTVIARRELDSGIYFWQLQSSSGISRNGKIVFE